jgi:hypothetical protein
MHSGIWREEDREAGIYTNVGDENAEIMFGNASADDGLDPGRLTLGCFEIRA